MQPAFTIAQLFPPIAAATVVNAFLFAGMWRGHQAEVRTGKGPWWLVPGIMAYGSTLGLFLYTQGKLPISGGLGVFGSAMLGEAAGGGVTYALLQAFVWSRGKPWNERAVPIGLSLVLATGVVAATLAV